MTLKANASIIGVARLNTSGDIYHMLGYADFPKGVVGTESRIFCTQIERKVNTDMINFKVLDIAKVRGDNGLISKGIIRTDTEVERLSSTFAY